MEVRPFRRADETLPQAHRSQTVPVPRLWTQLLPFWPPGFAQETPPPGVKPSETGQLERNSVLVSTLDSTTLTWGGGILKSWPYTLDSDREWGKCSSGCKFRPFHLISLKISWCQPINHVTITSSCRSSAHFDIIVDIRLLYRISCGRSRHFLTGGCSISAGLRAAPSCGHRTKLHQHHRSV